MTLLKYFTPGRIPLSDLFPTKVGNYRILEKSLQILRSTRKSCSPTLLPPYYVVFATSLRNLFLSIPRSVFSGLSISRSTALVFPQFEIKGQSAKLK